jgi:hypothetical protein
MPSLFKYFTIVGGVLLGLLTLANSILEPSGSGPSMVKATPKVIVKHDPQASLFERKRAEEAAQKAAAKSETLETPVTIAEPVASNGRPETEPLARYSAWRRSGRSHSCPGGRTCRVMGSYS